MISSWLNSYLAVIAVPLTLNAHQQGVRATFGEMPRHILLMNSSMFMLAQGIAVLGSFLSIQGTTCHSGA